MAVAASFQWQTFVISKELLFGDKIFASVTQKWNKVYQFYNSFFHVPSQSFSHVEVISKANLCHYNAKQKAAVVTIK